MFLSNASSGGDGHLKVLEASKKIKRLCEKGRSVRKKTYLPDS
jgi:hypothetical protein